MPYACTHSFLPKMRVFAFTVWLLLLGQPRSLFATENEIIPIEDFQKYLDEHFSVPPEPYHIREQVRRFENYSLSGHDGTKSLGGTSESDYIAPNYEEQKRPILSPSSRTFTSYTDIHIDQGDYRIMPLTSVYRKVKKKIDNKIKYLESVDVSCPSELEDDHPSEVQMIFDRSRCPNGLCRPGHPYKARAIICKAGWRLSTSALFGKSWMICANGIWSEHMAGTVCSPFDRTLYLRAQKKRNGTDRDIISNIGSKSTTCIPCGCLGNLI
eukprot:116700_1